MIASPFKFANFISGLLMRLIHLLCLCLSSASGLLAGLTEQQLQQYQTQGYLVIENFMDPDDCDALKQQALKLVNDFDPLEVQEIFSTQHQGKLKDAYFLESANNISFFFEPEAFLPNGDLRQAKVLSINKIGHAEHDLDPVFDKFSRSPKIAQLVADLGLDNPLLMQSMYIFKQPYIGGEVTCHQDGTFFFSDPDTSIGLWFAIEDATLENGCLWAIPGGHTVPLKSRFLRTVEGGTRFEIYDKSPWDLSGMVPLEAKKGTLIVLHSRVPHMSYANRSSKSRHAYTLHLIDASSNYPAENWLQRDPSFPPTGF